MHLLPRRLDKFVRETTRLSLVEARAALTRGEVTCERLGVPGDPLALDELIFAEDQVLFDGRRLSPPARHDTLIFHKPKGITSTMNDPRGRGDLSRFTEAMPPGVFPVGRLDRETTGALLFTTDGDLASMALRPDHALEKEYWLWLDESLTPEDPRLARCLAGIPMLDGVGRASRVAIQRTTEHYTELAVFLQEGKNRQIRRMCRALDFRLLHLHRKAIGPVTLVGVAPGEFRRLTDQEVSALTNAVGGLSTLRTKQYRALLTWAQSRRARGTPHPRLEAWLADNPEEAVVTRTEVSPSGPAVCTPP